jgi:hypothetical protein
MRASFQVALLVVLTASSITKARADGLVPCDGRGASFAKDLSEDSKGADRGEVVLSYLYDPSLWVGWGLQIARFNNRYLLRSLQYRRDLHGGTVELRPHVFGQNPVQPDPLVRTVSVSSTLVDKLREAVIAEIAQADQANARVGLDGEGYFFNTEGRCAYTWSPDAGSRPLRLASILDDLYTQSRLPTRLLQRFWEYRLIARLDNYTGSDTMSSQEYLFFTAAGVGVVVVAGLPLLIAWIATWIPRRPLRKFRFVLVSGALSYGFTCFLGVLLLPLVLLGSGIAAQLDVDGHSDWAIALDVMVKYSAYVLLNALAVFAVAVPIYLRRKGWSGSTEEKAL